MPQAKPIIEVQSLCIGYGERVLMQDVSFAVYPGEVFVVLGGSGAGKSTLLKHMIGLYPPQAGHILIDGDDLVTAGEILRHHILRKFGVMYQMGALFGSMSVLDNVALPLREYTQLDEHAIEVVARSKLKLVGLAAFADFMPAELSGGMQKRAAIARAMALDPRILFLDEPSAGLDPITSAGLDQLIKQLAGSLGVTFVVVTHELASIFEIADRVIMLDKARRGIIASGAPAELRDHSDIASVRQFFNRQAEAK